LSKANWHDPRKILETIEGIKIGKRRRRPKRLGLEKGDDSEPLRQQLRKRGIVPNAPDRSHHGSIPKGRPPKDKHEKRYCRQRWKVERSFAGLNSLRRLDRFLEENQKAYRAFMRVYFIKHDLNLLF